jgi:hypothetical protein
MNNQVPYRACLLGIALCTAGQLAVHASGVVSLLQVPPGPVSVGASFDVQVWALGPGSPVELLAFGFDVDPGSTFSLATYTGFTVGPGALPGAGLVNDVSGLFFPGAGDPLVLLATLAFTADTPGTETLAVRGLADNQFAGLFYADLTDLFDPVYSNDNIDASIPITVVPEPSAVLIVGAGLLGFGVWRRSRKA